MKKTVLAGLLMLVVSLLSQAGDVLTLKQGHPETYAVVKGDTLWHISGRFLDDPWKWPEIWHVNPQVDNPHLIFPGDVLNLVYIDGRPKLVVKRGRDVKLSPEVRISALDDAIPAIPLDAIKPFLSNSRVVSNQDLKAAPYVLSGTDGHIVSGAGDELYGRGKFKEGQAAWGIFREGKPFMDPETGEMLGIRADSIAVAQKIELNGDVATMAINQSSEEIRRGDRFFPEEDRRINSSFYPDTPKGEINGYIIAVEGGVTQIGSMDVIVINKGDREGIDVGHVLAIYRKGEQVRDEFTKETVQLPDTRAGLLMVFRTFDKVSYALVLKANKALSVMDKVKNP
jgi:nucleoid-associated protein YgaU